MAKPQPGQQIGWSLVDAKGEEIQFWGNKRGRVEEIPNVIVLPNGDRVHAASGGEALSGGKFRLVPRVMVDGAVDAVTFDGEQVVVMRAGNRPDNG